MGRGLDELRHGGAVARVHDVGFAGRVAKLVDPRRDDLLDPPGWLPSNARRRFSSRLLFSLLLSSRLDRSWITPGVVRRIREFGLADASSADEPPGLLRPIRHLDPFEIALPVKVQEPLAHARIPGLLGLFGALTEERPDEGIELPGARGDASVRVALGEDPRKEEPGGVVREISELFGCGNRREKRDILAFHRGASMGFP